MENPFIIDEDIAHKGLLYVTVDVLCTVKIYRAPGAVEVEICPLDNTVTALSTASVSDRKLKAAIARLTPNESN